MLKNLTINVTKVDADDLIKEYKVQSVEAFTSYLKEIWRVNI
jgi:hypothetical protein